MTTLPLKDSGSKDTFSTGAVRDSQANKLRYDLIPPGPLERLAAVYTQGAKKYDDRNWEKGMPFTRVYASLMRHLQSWLMRKTDEDHLAAVAWNAFALMFYEQERQQMDDRGANYTNIKPPAFFANNVCAEPPVESGEIGPHAKDMAYLLGRGCPERIARNIINAISYGKQTTYAYISGPMRGLPDNNFAAFDATSKKLDLAGITNISPAEIDRQSDMVGAKVTQDVYAYRDFMALLLTKARGGYIYMMREWESSIGAKAEKAIAVWLRLPVIYQSIEG